MKTLKLRYVLCRFISIVLLFCQLGNSAYAAKLKTIDLDNYSVSMADAAIMTHFNSNGLLLSRALYSHAIVSNRDVFYGSGDYDTFMPIPDGIVSGIKENGKFQQCLKNVKDKARTNKKATEKKSYSINLNNTDDLKYSLANANVTIDVDYLKDSNSYNIWITVTDKYDFHWKECDFMDWACYGNNLSYVKQQLNQLNNFKVSVCFSYSE